MISFRTSARQRGPAPGEAADAELVQAAREGDKRAFVQIVARYQAMVCGIALGVLNDFAASEDAAQEAFLTAWRKFHDLREPARLRPWLAQIARNAALGHLRRQRGEEPLPDDPHFADESALPDELAATEEESALVREALERLPEKYRVPLVLYYREGESVRTVAESLGISEDAVKQRLARGREMLRERMSGVIETALRRGPGPVFTMTIAAAIGALAAPAVIAGGVFTGAAAAGTSASHASTLFTAMSTTKTFAAAAAAVLCIPVGYQIARHQERPAPAPAALAETAPVQLAAADRARFENSALFAEWLALHERHGTNAAAMPLLHKAISDLPEESRRKAFHAALAAEWALVDPAAGFTFLEKDASQRLLFDQWLARDPSAAVDALLKAKNFESLATETLSDIARYAPSRLPEIASKLPKPRFHWDDHIREAFALIAESSIPDAREAAFQVQGPNRSEALAGIAKIWARSDLNQTIAWARELPSDLDHDEIIRAALIGRAEIDPISALDSVGIVPPGGHSSVFASTTAARVLGEAADTDFDSTAAWLASNSHQLTREDLLGLAGQVTDHLNADPIAFLSRHSDEGSLYALLPAISSALLNDAGGQRQAVWNWLQGQPANETTKTLKRDVLNSASWQEPELALRLAENLPYSAEGEKDALTIASALFNAGNSLHRFDAMYEAASPRLRPILLEAAFDHIPRGVPNPETWAARIPQLPEESRVAAARNLAAGWASRAPEAAFSWARSLPQGDPREQALSQAAATWARNDSQAAASWISRLPAGSDRDNAASAFAQQIAGKDPHAAWEWAKKIGDKTYATHAAFRAAQVMAARDPSTARQWAKTGPFNPELRAKLEQIIQASQQPKQ